MIEVLKFNEVIMNTFIFQDKGNTQIRVELSSEASPTVRLEFSNSETIFNVFFSYYLKNLDLNGKNYGLKEINLQKQSLKKSFEQFIDNYKI